MKMASREQPILQLGGDWVVDQSYDFSHFDDLEWPEAQGLPEVSFKPETRADTQIDELLESYRSHNGGSLEEEWMEQPDFIGSLPSDKLFLGEDFAFTPSPPPLTTLLGFTGDPEPEVGNHGFVFADEFLKDLNKELTLQVDTPPSSPTPPDQVAPEIVLEDTPIQIVFEDGFLQSPLSPDDVESVLSSASSQSPPPPAVSPSTSTVDVSCLHTDSSSWSMASSELYKVVENTEKARATPYSRPHKSSKSNKSKGRKQTASIDPNPSELELELMSKKDRKKLQNKNAAIRYRMKKKAESEVKRTEVEDLDNINMQLREKCESLEREVKCMRDLINDIRKARGQPPLPLSQSALALKIEQL